MIELASLIARQTKAQILSAGLAVAQALGVPVTAWDVGNPTDAWFQFLTEILDALEGRVDGWIRSAFLDYASADTALYDWLVIVAYQGFGYTARTATYATTSVELTNTGGGYYPLVAGQVTFQDPSTGATYHNTSGGVLDVGPGTTLDVDVIADVAGSASSADPGALTVLVTALPGVTCTNAIAAIGTDAEPAASIVAGCRAKLTMMSPNGAADAYRYVATSAELTGITTVTSARVDGDSDTGIVDVLLAGPSMPISAGDITAVETAIVQTCKPVCHTPQVASATALVQNVTYEAWGYVSWGVTAADAHTAITTALQQWFVERPIAGDVIPPATTGTLDVNMIEAAIKAVRPDKITRVIVTVPATGVAVGATQKPMCGTVTAAAPFHFIPEP